MLKVSRLTVLGALVVLPALVAGVATWVRSAPWLAPPPPPVGAEAPPNAIAEGAGLVVTYDPLQSGLGIMVGPAATAVRSSPPQWRELVRLEPRALVSQTWVPGEGGFPPPIIRQDGDRITVHLEDVQVSDWVRSRWSLTLSRTEPTFTLDRTDTLLRPYEVNATALALANGLANPHDRLVLVGGTAYMLTEGSIDRLGNHGPSGIVNRDPALTFMVQISEATRTRGERRSEGDLILLVSEPAVGSTIQSSARFHVGPRTPLQPTTATFAPETDSFLLAAGYYGNLFVSRANGSVLTASMVLYPDSVWMRDVAAASPAYLRVLDDTSGGVRHTAVFRNTLLQFIRRTSPEGVVPEYFDEAGRTENREAWDPMPDLIHATYAYVSKTRDTAFLQEHLETLQRVASWIRRLDTNGDGLPDRDIYPYGYYDSVTNGVMHTYAIASFYAAMLEMAELQELIGRDGSAYREYAERMRWAFNRPVSVGGYWQPDRNYPIAWRKSNGTVVTGFETFGVLAAVRAGLINDEDRVRAIGKILQERRDDFVNGNAFPTRLMLDGYDEALLRPELTPDRRWMLDANAPWLIGLDVAVRARTGAVADAALMLELYQRATVQYPPMPEFAAGPSARYGNGESHDGGRLWDNAAWFDAVYGTHYGIQMTPAALIVQPNPLRRFQTEDVVENVSYQGMHFRLALRPEGYTLTVLDGPPRTVVFQPTGRYKRVSVNGGPQRPTITVTARKGDVYRVQSHGL